MKKKFRNVDSLRKSHLCFQTAKGLFNQCLDKVMSGGIAKSYLTSHIGGNVEVKLNDGRCSVNESELLFYFHMSRKPSECGTEYQVRVCTAEKFSWSGAL